jgi:hypothetical protein
LEVSQDCPLSPTLFSINREAASFEREMQLKSHFSLGIVVVDILLFADDQVILAESEYE